MDPQFFIPNGLKQMIQIPVGFDKDKICTVDEFLAHIPDNGNGLQCRELIENGDGFQLRLLTAFSRRRLFGYRSIDTSNSTPPPLSVVIERKVETLINSLTLWSDDVLVQFWAPAFSEKVPCEKVLPIASQQPFGLNGLANGLCQYRYLCSRYCLFDKIDLADLGPPGRVFTSGYPEKCDNIGCYTIQEFPLRDVAKACGIKCSYTYPLFQRWENKQQCVGVLEFLFLNSREYYTPENRDFVSTSSSHSPECKKIHCKYVSSHHDALKQVLSKPIGPYNRIQFWVPCTCENGNNSMVTQLFCQLPWFHWDTSYSIDPLHKLKLDSETYFVKVGKSWVGRACLLNKVCFFSDISQLSITDYPLPHLVRSNEPVSSCFAIPLPLIHPSLPPLILEAFLPQSKIWDESLETNLKELLTGMGNGLSKHNVAFELKNKEKFIVEFSHSDDENFVYFNVYRREEFRGSNKRKQTELQINLDAIKNGQNYGGDNGEPKTLDRGGSSFTNDEAGIITLDTIKSYYGRDIDDAAKELKVSRSTLKRRCRTLGIERWPSHKRFSKVNNQIGQTSARVFNEEGDSSEFDKESMAGASDKNADSIPMTMSATYKGDTIKFPFNVNSGIEELSFALAKRFDLGTDENFKIKFEDEGEWILISCDEDLHFNLTRMKSSGQTLVKLLVEIKKGSIS